MKVNMPVTDVEVHFQEGQTLVSKTDLKGILTYVNQEFIDISGFTEQELIGKNHNLVRHPDMPPEAFQDLWSTIKAGKPWVQLVKNRCKNGDYYWVKANVTPIWQAGKVVEYMSVRSKPSREEIAAAEAAHQQIKNGKLSLLNGNPTPSGLAGKTAFLNNISVKNQFVVMGVLFLFLALLVGIQLNILKGNLDFTEKQVLGTEYLETVTPLLRSIPEHRGLVHGYLNGEAAFKSRIDRLQDDVSAAFKKIDSVDTKLGAALGTTAQLNSIQRDWRSLSSNALNLTAADSFARHSKLINNIQELMLTAGSHSNLLLDPEADSYYNMDLVLNKIPAMTDYIGKLRGQGTGILAENQLTEASREQLIENATGLTISLTAFQYTLEAAESASAEVKEALSAQGSDLKKSVARLTNEIQKLRQGDLSTDPQQFFRTGTDAIDTAFQLHETSNALLIKLIEERVLLQETRFYSIAVLTILSVLIVFIIGFRVIRRILHTLHQTLSNLTAISNSDFSQAIDMVGNDELAELSRGITSMRIKTGFDVEDGAKRAAEATRIRQALDVCKTNVMMADNDLNIIYMNNSIVEMLDAAEEDIQKDLPQFNANDLMGTNVDLFHKNPGHQRGMIAQLQEPYETQIKIGGRTFNLNATPVKDKHGNRLGTVVEWQDQTEELARLKEEKRVANENLRIKQALDSVSANVMMADADRQIIYMNDAVYDTLKSAESDLRKDLPSFDVERLMGHSIDQFHKNPEHQKQLLATLTDKYEASIVVGGRHMHLTVNPVMNDEGDRLGSVIEWDDRTAEVAIETEIDELVGAASRGDLSNRINMTGKTGFFENLGHGLNNLVASAESILSDVGKTFSALSSGDLTQSISTQYQGDFERIKNDANATIDKLTEIISKISESANTVNTASNEIAQGNSDLSQRTEEQASSLEETASSMEEMTSTVKQSSDSASEANRLASDATHKARQGGDVVKQAVEAMAEILKSSNRINDIIGVIDEIAFQTNLLALNAAVEAARAGEQGRGFAVVAGEVRNLSQRSAAAAKEIKDLIKDSVSKVQAGSILVNESGDTLTSIVQAVEKVAHMISEISNAAAEQTSGIEQINQAVAQMDEMTQQNAALVEEASAASEAMSEQANSMSRLVGFFKMGDLTETFGAASNASDSSGNVHTEPSGFTDNVRTYAKQDSAQEQYSNQQYSNQHANNPGSKSSFADDDEWEEF
ncbi:MAG: methyl-accepting chemotaxis protein [Pseudomonadales bacterium]|nr:methyl-accepting chemotaxis protein [Pseudomonadales bacterium]